VGREGEFSDVFCCIILFSPFLEFGWNCLGGEYHSDNGGGIEESRF
jgi:hypothetical protein